MLNYSSCISIKYYTYFNIVPRKKKVENLKQPNTETATGFVPPLIDKDIDEMDHVLNIVHK